MTEIYWVLYSAGYLLFAVIFLLFAKKLFDGLTSYSVNTQLTAKDNPAVGLLLSGFLPVSYTHLTLPTKRIV